MMGEEWEEGKEDMGTKLSMPWGSEKAKGSLMGDDEDVLREAVESSFIGIKVNPQNFGKQIFICNPCAFAWPMVS